MSSLAFIHLVAVTITTTTTTLAGLCSCCSGRCRHNHLLALGLLTRLLDRVGA